MNRPIAALGRIQRQLERTYDVAIPHHVGEFLVTDPTLLAAIRPLPPDREPTADDAERNTGSRPGPAEQLLVAEHDDEVDIGLFLDDEVLRSLDVEDPTGHLDAENLPNFCLALEGVSHFVYLVWNTGWERPVSLLQLELQAEVDKFVAVAFLFARQQGGVPRELADWLFTAPRFRDELSPDERGRYEMASHYAGRYCAMLERTFLGGDRKAGLMSELRRFYRVPRTEKIRYIQQREQFHVAERFRHSEGGSRGAPLQ